MLKRVFCFVLCAFCLAAQSLWAQSATGDEKNYFIGVGDVLEVQVWQEPDLSRTVKVRLDGKISLPLTGDVQAAGKAIEELDSFLEKKIAALVTEPSVSVMLVENRSRRYYVVGQVGQPGEFPIEYPLTLLQAIARSGGFQEWAKREEIKVARRTGSKEELLRFDYDAFVKGKDLGQNIFIAPGDTIIVP
ncbi:MAG: polysaccharide biosynthesis/export family protein [Pseudomonadota bacterium]